MADVEREEHGLVHVDVGADLERTFREVTPVKRSRSTLKSALTITFRAHSELSLSWRVYCCSSPVSYSFAVLEAEAGSPVQLRGFRPPQIGDVHDPSAVWTRDEPQIAAEAS